jgi:hypothetical protein
VTKSLARTVEFTPETIVIDGQPLPWPLSLDWSVNYRPHPFAKNAAILSFAVLAREVRGLPADPILDGHPVPWQLGSRGLLVSRFNSSEHRVVFEIPVDTSPDDESAGE